jgi:uncharacterized RmlC-like cupin family protein
MSNSSAIRIIHPSEFDKGTQQTSGSERRAAVAPQLGVDSTMWGGVFEVKPGARTGIHHQGCSTLYSESLMQQLSTF